MILFRAMVQPVDQRPVNENEPPGTPLACRGFIASDVVVEVAETSVRVTFNPMAQHYYFGRLTDSDDVARFGPLSCRPETDQLCANDDARQLERLAYWLAMRAISSS